VPRRRLTRVVLGLVIALVLVGGGLGVAVAGGWLLHDTAKPASVSSAVTHLRTSGAKGGVFVYVTRGSEALNAFVKARHVYPLRTALTIVPAACGQRLTWAALEGRSTTWTLCRTSRGFELRAETEVHQFFGGTDRTRYACTDALLGPSGRLYRCRSAHGHENGEIHALGREELTVGGRRLAALHVQTVGQVAGGDSGTETTDWWLEPKTGLPLRLAFTSRTSRPLHIGSARYSERADLRLVSTSPRR
jgi:hypothetical protein